MKICLPMKFFLILLTFTGICHAKPECFWVAAACGGRNMEIVTDQAAIRSIRTSEVLSSSIIEWTVHFCDGRPISAEYRALTLSSNDKELGMKFRVHSRIKQIRTWPANEGRFSIDDEALAKELNEILEKVAALVVQRNSGNSKQGE
jgi:hypothetical protein